eukprot:SAG11_NODE_6486_length_1304_cov_2.117842_1_plen_413_part_10
MVNVHTAHGVMEGAWCCADFAWLPTTDDVKCDADRCQDKRRAALRSQNGGAVRSIFHFINCISQSLHCSLYVEFLRSETFCLQSFCDWELVRSYAAEFGVPIIMASGDDALGNHQTRTRSMQADRVQEEIATSEVVEGQEIVPKPELIRMLVGPDFGLLVKSFAIRENKGNVLHVVACLSSSSDYFDTNDSEIVRLWTIVGEASSEHVNLSLLKFDRKVATGLWHCAISDNCKHVLACGFSTRDTKLSASVILIWSKEGGEWLGEPQILTGLNINEDAPDTITQCHFIDPLCSNCCDIDKCRRRRCKKYTGVDQGVPFDERHWRNDDKNWDPCPLCERCEKLSTPIKVVAGGSGSAAQGSPTWLRIWTVDEPKTSKSTGGHQNYTQTKPVTWGGLNGDTCIGPGAIRRVATTT